MVIVVRISPQSQVSTFLAHFGVVTSFEQLQVLLQCALIQDLRIRSTCATEKRATHLTYIERHHMEH